MPAPPAAAGVLALVDAALRAHFAQDPARASVSFVGVAPIEILRFEPVPGERAYVSLGMSAQPMTSPGSAVADPQGPRAELFLHVVDPADHFAGVWRQLAVLAAAPAVEGVVHRPDLTVDLGAPLAPGSRCTGGLIATSAVPDVAVPGAAAVQVLQVLPATPQELAWGRGRGGAALRARWQEERTDLGDLGRVAVALV